jgi:hypothetical protein
LAGEPAGWKPALPVLAQFFYRENMEIILKKPSMNSMISL